MPAWLRPLTIALAAPLLLMGCLLTPGKFTSTLSIDADRSFTFTYVGEVIASDPSESMSPPSDGEETSEADENEASFILTQGETKAEQTPAEKKAATEAKRRAIAEALSKEAGYRSVKYVGDGKFMIDYRISGTLDHSFIYPFNVDAEAVLPFIAIEVRANGTVRMRAPGFANESRSSGMMGGMGAMGGDAPSKLDGVFTLDTDAEIVSQNNEDGPTTANGRKTIRWRASPLTKDAPSAVLRVTGSDQ